MRMWIQLSMGLTRFKGFDARPYPLAAAILVLASSYVNPTEDTAYGVDLMPIRPV